MSKTKRKHRSSAIKPVGIAHAPAGAALEPPASPPCMTEAEVEALVAAPCKAEPETPAAACVAEAEALVAAAEVAAEAEPMPPQPRAKPEPPADWVQPAEAAAPRPSVPEAERDVLLKVITDRVFRVRLQPDGGVAVADGRARTGSAGHEAGEGAVLPAAEGEPADSGQGLKSELARRGRQLMDAFRESGEVQTLEIETGHDGQARCYEIRAAGCVSAEMLAVVHNGQTTFLEIGAPAGAAGELLVLARDVTARKEAESSIARTQDELTRLNQVLESEASVHAEDEEIMESAFRKLGRLLEDTIGAIQMIVQMKDPPTAQHQARVCKLACAIGREMGLEKSQVDTIGLAALLHDLGKILIPSDMLNKPGRLTEKELTAIRNSAETEYQILKTIDLFCPIADIVHQHHERLDGSGYPLGLKGEDILLEARVIAVADVVEAMVSERPYRPALSLGAALKEIQVNKGRLYDPTAVEACSSLFMGGAFEFDSAEDNSLIEGAYSGA